MARNRSVSTAGTLSSMLALAFVLTACGSGGGSNATGPADPLPAPTSPVSTRAPASSGPGPESSSQGAVPAEGPVAAEDNPPGDIPDNLAFVAYRNVAGRYSFTHPEGWAETQDGSRVVFTDKLNGVQVQVGTRSAAASAQQAKGQDVPALQRSQPAFELRSVSAVTVGTAQGVRIVYRRNSEPDPVTGRQYRDEVERYALVSGGRELIVELYGPVGADNIDAYKTMIESLRFA